MDQVALQAELREATRSKSLPLLIQALEQGAKPQWFTSINNPWTALQEAASVGFIAGMDKLIEAGAGIDDVNFEYYTPLMRAAAAGQVEAGRWLLARGANVHARSHYKETALVASLVYGKLAFADMLLDECPEFRGHPLQAAASQLIDRHCFGHLIHWHRLDVAQWLLAQGVSPDTKTAGGRSWLSVLEEEFLGDGRPILDLLLRAGAQVNAQDRQGNTVLHQALTSSSMLVTLLKAGADPDLANNDGHSVRNMIDRLPLDNAVKAAFIAWESSCVAQHVIDAATPAGLKIL